MPTKHSGGPGSTVSRGVRSAMANTMDARVSPGGGGGIHDHNKAPFDKPHDMGGGGISLKFFDAMTAKVPTTSTAGQASPPSHGQQNVGTRRFKNPK